jgi:hypothetical protein
MAPRTGESVLSVLLWEAGVEVVLLWEAGVEVNSSIGIFTGV